MSNTDRLVDVHRRFVQRQWLAIKNRGWAMGADSATRMEELRRLGLVTLQSAVASAGITPEDLARCALAVRRDPRLKFLQQLPLAAAGGGAIGDALQMSLYGSASTMGMVRETTALIHMFARILDSLIDEAPQIIAPERSSLIVLLSAQSWTAPAAFPADQALETKHPAASLLYKLMGAFVANVRRSDVWLLESSRTIREDLATAVQAALQSEYNTIDCRMPERSQDYEPVMRRTLTAKSQDIVWVMGLAPTAFLGWPDHLDKPVYEACMRRLGDLFGWLDDVQDFLDDMEGGATNELLLDLYEDAGTPAYSTSDELHDQVAEWLGNELTVQRLVTKGQALYTDTMRGFEELGADPVPIQQYVTDVSLSWIQPRSELDRALLPV